MTQDPKGSELEELRRSMASLLHVDFAGIQNEIEQLQELIRNLQALSNPLPEDIQKLQESSQKLLEKTRSIEQNLSNLHADLEDPQKVTDLLKLGLHPALQQGIEDTPDLYGETIAPVISPAIRNQIRNAREEMIEALSPIIGQTIGKAIAEAFQDFRRRIDAQLKQNLNLSQQLKRFFTRIRGVSEADMLIRASLPYTITHVFLIKRDSGLLLQQVSQKTDLQDMDIISGMLTAIRDFAGDAFGRDGSELEEIQYGNSHILLKAGRSTYLAAVVEGVQPPGYVDLLGRTVHELNIKYEDALHDFQGDMSALPDFSPELRPLLNPSSDEMGISATETELNRGQKIAFWAGLAGTILLLALVVFGCIFSFRLMPLAFPAPTFTPIPATATLAPTFTNSPTAIATATITDTPIPSATSSPTPGFTATPIIYQGVMTGNVWAHESPDPESPTSSIVVEINTQVELKEVYNDWVKISWISEFGINEGWVPLKYVGITYPLPSEIVTPVR